MSAWIFAYNAVFAAIAVGIAFLPLSGSPGKPSPKLRRVLVCGTAIAAIPLIATAIFGLFPAIALAMIPLDVYARVEWEYWLPFAVFVFSLASHLVRPRNRKALVVLACLVAVFAVQQKTWHIVRPAAYDLKGQVVDGVCFQSTGYTCGAASAVTLLKTMGIDATEGEMAELTLTAPGRGISAVGAAYGLKRKLARESRLERVSLEDCGKDHLDSLPTPFLVGLKFKIWCDHMVCVLQVDKDVVTLGDPLVGRKDWDRKEFEDEVRGMAVVVRDDR